MFELPVYRLETEMLYEGVPADQATAGRMRDRTESGRMLSVGHLRRRSGLLAPRARLRTNYLSLTTWSKEAHQVQRRRPIRRLYEPEL